jgi:hypothetical protein
MAVDSGRGRVVELPATGDRHEKRKAKVLEELEHVLESPVFRNSHQSQRLMRHLVERSLEGRFEDLRERALAVDLFGREAGFDANVDPIVRVRANDIRKRLSRYYENLQGQPEVRFHLPPGSYRVEFETPGAEALSVPPHEIAQVTEGPEKTAAPAEEPRAAVALPPASAHWSRKQWVYLALVVIVLLAAASAGTLLSYTRSPLDQFWSPLLANSGGRIIVCTGHPVVYRFAREFFRSSTGGGVFPRTETDVYRPRAGDKIDGQHIVAVEDQYTGLGSAQAMARVAAWVAARGHGADIRFGHDISLTDLKQSSAVLLGYANRWTLSFTSELRFVPSTVDSMPAIRDQKTGRTWFLKNLRDDGRTDEDYVVVTRTFSSDSGRSMLAVAGLTQYGTQAGGEVVTNPAVFAELLAGVPPGWQKRNLQLLLHVRVVEHAPATPRLIDSHQW